MKSFIYFLFCTNVAALALSFLLGYILSFLGVPALESLTPFVLCLMAFVPVCLVSLGDDFDIIDLFIEDSL